MGDPAPDEPEHLRIAVGRAHLSVLRRGAGGSPSLVFLHAGIADLRSWRGVMDLLGPGTDVVAYDRRGFGTTTYVAETHDQVADLHAVLDVLALEQVVLVGNSAGGQIALDATLAHPDRVAALVLVGTAVTGAPQVGDADVDPAEAAIWETLAAADAAGALDALNLGEVRLWLDGPQAAEGRVGGELRALALRMNRLALHAESPGYEPEPPDAWSRLTEVACPTLVVVGDLDLAHLQARSRHLAAHIPGARLEVMTGAAHLPAYEQPVAFVEIVRRFLADSPFRPAPV